MSEEPSAPIPKSPRRPCLWGRRDRGYKPQIQYRAEATVRRLRPGKFLRENLRIPFFLEKLQVSVGGVILSKTRRFYSRVKPRILSSKVTPPDQRGWVSIRCERHMSSRVYRVLVRMYSSHLILTHHLVGWRQNEEIWSDGVTHEETPARPVPPAGTSPEL